MESQHVLLHQAMIYMTQANNDKRHLGRKIEAFKQSNARRTESQPLFPTTDWEPHNTEIWRSSPSSTLPRTLCAGCAVFKAASQLLGCTVPLKRRGRGHSNFIGLIEERRDKFRSDLQHRAASLRAASGLNQPILVWAALLTCIAYMTSGPALILPLDLAGCCVYLTALCIKERNHVIIRVWVLYVIIWVLVFMWYVIS